MTGVNIGTLDNIISKLEDVNSTSNKNLDGTISGLKRCYNPGSDLDYIFKDSSDENTFSGIKEMLSSYALILESVKKSYIKQEQIFSDNIKNINIV